MLREIESIETAMQQVEDTVQSQSDISEHLIHSLHAMTVAGLQREGDRTPGAYVSF